MPADPAVLRRALAEEIAAANPALDTGWCDAVAAVPRELFLGSSVFQPTGRGWEPVHRAEAGEDGWVRMGDDHRATGRRVQGKFVEFAVRASA
ncbi:hypothetical protein ACJ6WF_18370 [Streptomyces sp. MMS24-I2-30]|uniref:hypothetical protein n=1 Tax=Streptomyces sp. MMS24-I2-30 TaxID=3351564 RepID=UPI003896CEBC